jgi:hypothetical protein
MKQEAGTMNAEGEYPENSINFKAVERLKAISDMSSEDDKSTEEGI